MQTGIKSLNARFFTLMLSCAAFFEASSLGHLELPGTREYILYNHTEGSERAVTLRGGDEIGELQT
ncbi:hypothetical protein L8C07_13040 [Paenibacillus sp. CMAA1739]|uniref:hypothetical protein n=1 Tax=Paenibacillus ottowii TaxID=2315729 RepID=UPI002DB941E6|nr:hypothetical protein [Paenibacillus sp. CMAA1739]MEC4566869.1 hypothetical protein [Paenibacillus sp. CMAA1739]